MTENWNESGFAEFYAEHYPAVRAYAARLFGVNEADDVAQETMLRALVRGVDLSGSPRPWLFLVARNVGIDVHRRRNALPVEAEALGALVPEVPDEAVAVAHRLDVVRVLRQAMRRLCQRDREVLVLHEIDGIGIPDIARAAGISTNAARQRLFRARQNLGRHYTEMGGVRYGIVPAATPRGRNALASVARQLVVKVETALSNLPGTGQGRVAAGALVALLSTGAVASGAPQVGDEWTRPSPRTHSHGSPRGALVSAGSGITGITERSDTGVRVDPGSVISQPRPTLHTAIRPPVPETPLSPGENFCWHRRCEAFRINASRPVRDLAARVAGPGTHVAGEIASAVTRPPERADVPVVASEPGGVP